MKHLVLLWNTPVLTSLCHRVKNTAIGIFLISSVDTIWWLSNVYALLFRHFRAGSVDYAAEVAAGIIFSFS